MRIRLLNDGVKLRLRLAFVKLRVIRREPPEFGSVAPPAIAAGVLLAGIANPAYALNGFLNVSQCSSCQTTADFAASAKATAQKIQMGDGVYQVVSASAAETAFIQVTGQWTPHSNRYYVTSTVPVDAAGNSLAGSSESDLEVFFGALDQVLAGTTRNNPVYQAYSGVSSFVGLSDQNASFILNNGNFGIANANYKVGDTVTLTFPDGTKAQYQLADRGTSLTTRIWKWNGYAYDKNGNRIDRNGKLINNNNTSGQGGGSVRVPGFGPGSSTFWEEHGGGRCESTTTITVNGEATDYVYVGPC